MNKIKKISLISIVIGVICTIISMYSYIDSKNTNIDNIYKLSYALTSIINAILVMCYIALFFTKENKYKNRKGLILSINILTFFASVLYMIVSFICINIISKEIFILINNKHRTFVIKPEKNLDGTFNKIDIEANILAKEFKRIQDLRMNNEISEEDYQKYKKSLCEKIGIDPNIILENSTELTK